MFASHSSSGGTLASCSNAHSSSNRIMSFIMLEKGIFFETLRGFLMAPRLQPRCLLDGAANLQCHLRSAQADRELASDRRGAAERVGRIGERDHGPRHLRTLGPGQDAASDRQRSCGMPALWDWTIHSRAESVFRAYVENVILWQNAS
jgi:hypothetical protein